MALFTVVMEYNEGTYISQIKNASPENALRLWGTSLDLNTIPNFGSKSKKILLNELLDCNHKLVLLDKMVNAWCTSLVIRNKLILLNIIKTDTIPPNSEDG